MLNIKCKKFTLCHLHCRNNLHSLLLQYILYYMHYIIFDNMAFVSHVLWHLLYCLQQFHPVESITGCKSLLFNIDRWLNNHCNRLMSKGYLHILLLTYLEIILEFWFMFRTDLHPLSPFYRQMLNHKQK